jgi:outer membrane protein assembly factor BamB
MEIIKISMKLMFIFITASFLACCNKNEPITPTSPLKLSWSIPIEGANDDYKRVDINDDVIYNNGVVISHYTNGKRSLRMIDLATQKERWIWTEDIHLAFNIDLQYQYEKYLVAEKHNKVYCIDLETGKSVFINTLDFPYCNNWTSGIGNTFFISNYEEKGESSMYKGDIRTGQIVKYLTPDYEREFSLTVALAIPRLMYKATTTVYQGDTLLNVLYVEPNPPYDMFPKMGLYNMSQKKWLYQNKRVVDPATGYNTMPNGARIIGDRIYLASGHDIICFELLTGKEIWRRNDFLHLFAFAFHGFEIYDNKLIATSEEGKTYAIDTDTGKNIWVLENMGGTNSFIRYHNGVLYYLAGARLRCVDIKTGEILASLSTPDGEYMQQRVVVVPQPNNEKAKVIIFSYKNMYVYEAIR